MTAAKSWVDVPSDSDFSIDNIPFGVCSFPKYNGDASYVPAPCSNSLLAPFTPRCCTAIGKYAVDLHILADAGLLDNLIVAESESNGASMAEVVVANFHPRIVFSQSSLNDFMACEKNIWMLVRNRSIRIFLSVSESDILSPDMTHASKPTCPFEIKPSIHLWTHCIISQQRLVTIRISTARGSMPQMWALCFAGRTMHCSPIGCRCPSRLSWME
mmetsp:Transcript_16606/g.29274  ORF Transcript_16606/g.29274 Transcript_16606/m.29274 type:complete len:215 (-) Transcript_16606:298-942(-)